MIERAFTWAARIRRSRCLGVEFELASSQRIDRTPREGQKENTELK